MKKKKIKFIYVPIYDVNIWYFKGWKRADMQAFLTKKYNFTNFSDAKNIGGSVTILPLTVFQKGRQPFSSTVYCLYLTSERDIGIVAHEVFHIVSKVLRNRIGMELTDDSEEAFAYLITYICDQIKN